MLESHALAKFIVEGFREGFGDYFAPLEDLSEDITIDFLFQIGREFVHKQLALVVGFLE